MPTKGISPAASLVLELLKKFSWLDKFYLAGGTALALQLHHRLSFDLDFFTAERFDQKIINENLQTVGGYKLDRLAEATLLGVIRGTKISFFTYNYPLISDPADYEGVKLASLGDIAAMKIDAVAGRGTKRDFVDLYFICQQYSLGSCLDFYLKKYPGLSENKFHVIRSLSYFEEAESPGQELTMLKPVSWEKVKRYFESESINLANTFLQKSP